MVYIAPADFRVATLAEWTIGLDLTTTEVSDANLTGLIATCSGLFDRYTGDHFEAESGQTLVLDGEDCPRLWVPKRIRAITSVAVTYPGGASVTVPSSAYTFEPFTGDFSQIEHESQISLWGGAFLWPSGWPGGDSNVTIVGDFSWPTTPGEVKRAVAYMCWERVRPVGDYLRYADTFTEDGGTVTIGEGPVSRIPEAQSIADFFRRKPKG